MEASTTSSGGLFMVVEVGTVVGVTVTVLLVGTVEGKANGLLFESFVSTKSLLVLQSCSKMLLPPVTTWAEIQFPRFCNIGRRHDLCSRFCVLLGGTGRGGGGGGGGGGCRVQWALITWDSACAGVHSGPVICIKTRNVGGNF